MAVFSGVRSKRRARMREVLRACIAIINEPDEHGRPPTAEGKKAIAAALRAMPGDD